MPYDLQSGIESGLTAIGEGLARRSMLSAQGRKKRALYELLKKGVPEKIAAAGIEAGKTAEEILSDYKASTAEGAITAGQQIEPVMEKASNLAQMESSGLSVPERNANVEQAAGLTKESPRQPWLSAAGRTQQMEKDRADREKLKKDDEMERAAKRNRADQLERIQPGLSRTPVAQLFIEGGDKSPTLEQVLSEVRGRPIGMEAPSNGESKGPTPTQIKAENMKAAGLKAELEWEQGAPDPETGQAQPSPKSLAEQEALKELGPRTLQNNSGYDSRLKAAVASKKLIFIKQRQLDALQKYGLTAEGDGDGGEEEAYFESILDDLERQIRDARSDLYQGR